jgi:hypothetical protein
MTGEGITIDWERDGRRMGMDNPMDFMDDPTFFLFSVKIDVILTIVD